MCACVESAFLGLSAVCAMFCFVGHGGSLISIMTMYTHTHSLRSRHTHTRTHTIHRHPTSKSCIAFWVLPSIFNLCLSLSAIIPHIASASNSSVQAKLFSLALHVLQAGLCDGLCDVCVCFLLSLVMSERVEAEKKKSKSEKNPRRVFFFFRIL